jgi:AcrR family transcriptional regulator
MTPAPVPAEKVADKTADTKTRILLAAEKLFAVNGFDATSLRDITTEAQVNLAAVNYHFQSKDSLIDAVIEHRLGPINEKRLAGLAAAGANPTVEQIVEAFLAPVLEFAIPVAPLLARVFSNMDQFVERVYRKHLHTMVLRFMEALQKALPEVPPDELFWRLHFMAGSMSHTILMSSIVRSRGWGTERAPGVEGAVVAAAIPMAALAIDPRQILERMVAYAAAGMRAPVKAAAHQENMQERKQEPEEGRS